MAQFALCDKWNTTDQQLLRNNCKNIADFQLFAKSQMIKLVCMICHQGFPETT